MSAILAKKKNASMDLNKKEENNDEMVAEKKKTAGFYRLFNLSVLASRKVFLYILC